MRPSSQAAPDPVAPSSATPAQATPDFGLPPKRGAHAIFDLGAVASEMPAPPAGVTEAPQRSAEEAAPAPEEPPTAPPLPAVEIVPPVPPAPAVSARATLDIEVRVKRAGTNLLSAAVEYDIVVRNVGQAVARAIQVDVRLLSAGVEQDGWIATLFSSPIERPITPSFELPSRGAIELSGMAMMPKDMLSVMTVQDRILFVPVLAINMLYEWEGGTGQTAISHVIGIDRGEGVKMAPFRLDAGPRMHEGVNSLPYTVSVRR
ncbi:MAG: hypothetical protein P0Y59_10010 [Candidatus Sphingomonas phytovorans]|nr:hypothetical protein [Sphingomonas sp.]WEK01986.1 MAG: hypothetical protein P0Y59_10010 [Sphingomonas sp.]